MNATTLPRDVHAAGGHDVLMDSYRTLPPMCSSTRTLPGHESWDRVLSGEESWDRVFPGRAYHDYSGRRVEEQAAGQVYYHGEMTGSQARHDCGGVRYVEKVSGYVEEHAAGAQRSEQMLIQEGNDYSGTRVVEKAAGQAYYHGEMIGSQARHDCGGVRYVEEVSGYVEDNAAGAKGSEKLLIEEGMNHPGRDLQTIEGVTSVQESMMIV